MEKKKKILDYYVRSSDLSLRFTNGRKRDKLVDFINEYQKTVQHFIDILWTQKQCPKTMLKGEFLQPKTWLSARALQASFKQASGIVRGTRKKQSQRLFVIEKLKSDGIFKQARKLQAIYDQKHSKKPEAKSVNPELDSRFVTFDFENKTSFDGFVTFNLGTKDFGKVVFPVKKTSHFNKLESQGIRTNGMRLSKDSVTFMFKIKKKQVVKTKETIGIDVGKITLITCSDKTISSKNKHGHDLNSIIQIMGRQKKGSKAFARSQNHRTNYINWSINQLNLGGRTELVLENIKNLRKGRNSSASLSRWTYTEIFGKLESKCLELDVPVHYVNPRYTSQRCSSCGWVRKGNRKLKMFNCNKCFITLDADLNGSINISLKLPELHGKQLSKNANKTGFYWFSEKQESIVPVAQKVIS